MSNIRPPRLDLPDRDLALWMLQRMKNSAEFMVVVRKARIDGKRDVLDTPDYVARHSKRVAKLFQSDTEEDIAAASSTAAAIEEIMRRDVISSREEFLEKAIAAYLEKHGAEGVAPEWQSTFEAARAEIEGRTSGAFAQSFVASLANAARDELSAEAEKSRSAERNGRD